MSADDSPVRLVIPARARFLRLARLTGLSSADIEGPFGERRAPRGAERAAAGAERAHGRLSPW
jgi:hypothetical protein